MRGNRSPIQFTREAPCWLLLESDAMSFTVGLSADLVQVEAGATVPLNIEIANRSDQADRFEVSVEGLDPEWAAVPVPIIPLDSHDSQTAKIFLKPPRVSESISGTYPFVVTIRSLESGETRSAQAILEIKPFHHVSVEISPKRGVISALAKQYDFTVTVMNLGNCEHTLQLHASDPDDECAFEFDNDKVTVGPGQQKDVVLSSSGTRRPLLASPRLNSFSVTARSVESPSVAGSAQAQLEQRALVSPGTLIFFIALVALALTWLYFMPKPPTLDQFSLNRTKIMVGESVTLSWSASSATTVDVNLNGEPVPGVASAMGSTTITPTLPGDYTVSGVAVRGDNHSDRKNLVLTVEAAPTVPEAKIVEFKISPKSVSLGDVINVHYKLNDFAVKATLSPPGVALDIKANDKEIQTQRAGKIDYTLIAYNSAGKDVRQTFTVFVTEGPTIVAFKSDKQEVDLPGETVKLSYQMTNAVRAELDDGSGQPAQPLDPPDSGTKEITITKTTTFTLIGYDAKGKSSKRTLTVKLKEQQPPATTDGQPTTGGGN